MVVLAVVVGVLIVLMVGGALARSSRRARRAAYGSPLILAAACGALAALSPPCEDFLDGPCEKNWVSDAAWLALSLTVLALAAVVALVAVQAGQTVARRVRSDKADAPR